MPPQKIILDTDIGDDIDDAMALALICASPELELLGVTTVFGNTIARARQARTILKTAGEPFAHIPVAAGCGATMASRPTDFGGKNFYLNDTLPNQDASCLPENQLAPLDPRHGVDFLIETISRGDGDIIPITIGAMTNLAMAFVKEPRIIAKIPKIVAMAAEFRLPMAEWNIRCDPEAAAIVCSSGVPIDFTPWHIGYVVTFDPSNLDQLAKARGPIGAYLSRTIAAWVKAHDRMPALYDPMAIATMIQPELCEWKRGNVSVELQGDKTYGFTMFTESSEGKHRIAWDAKRDASLEYFLSRAGR